MALEFYVSIAHACTSIGAKIATSNASCGKNIISENAAGNPKSIKLAMAEKNLIKTRLV